MEIIRLSDTNFAGAVKRARDVLARGGIVLYPTDTLYGLGVDARNRGAIERLRELKGREKKKPVSVVVADADDIDAHAELPMHAKWYADRFLPGALTLVLPGREHLPAELMLNGKLGIRIPDEEFARAMARAFGAPVTATSANRAGLPTPIDADGVLAHFGNLSAHIDLVIDAGERAGGTPSTVITFVDGEPYILREGALSRRDLGL